MSDRETVPGTVVVGVDGSEGSLHALDWAIDAAAGRGATLRLVYAMGLPLVTVPLGGPIRTAPSPEVSQAAKALLEEALRRVQEAAPSLRAVTEVSRAEAHHALLKSAQDAELLVVGSRGYSGVASLFLGSVAQRVASHATCPVVVVPPTSQDAAAGLRFALVEAGRLRAELVAVYAWPAPDAPVDPFAGLQADVAVDRAQQVARAREWLLRTVDEARTPLTQRFPVRVETPEKH